MPNILFIGDINGKIGRRTVAKILPGLKKKERIDLAIANAENCAHGAGVTEETLDELLAAGVDFFTGGDHSFDKIKKFDVYEKYPIIAPANFAPKVPGDGYRIIEIKSKKILVINLIGRVFMKMDHECPFAKIDEILAKTSLPIKNLSAIIVDIHAEATSEKTALKHYIDGRASAILGTHTHIQTADEKISEKGTGYLTDVGMTGFADGVIGVEKDGILKTFLTQISSAHVIPEIGNAIFNAVLIKINDKTRRAESIKRINESIKIK